MIPPSPQNAHWKCLMLLGLKERKEEQTKATKPVMSYTEVLDKIKENLFINTNN